MTAGRHTPNLWKRLQSCSIHIFHERRAKVTYLELRARPVTAGSGRAVEHQEVLVIVVVLKDNRFEVGGINQELIRYAQKDWETVVGYAAGVGVTGLVNGRELRQRSGLVQGFYAAGTKFECGHEVGVSGQVF